MQVWGDDGGQLEFSAGSSGAALAWIVDVPALEQQLAEAVRYQPQIETVAGAGAGRAHRGLRRQGQQQPQRIRRRLDRQALPAKSHRRPPAQRPAAPRRGAAVVQPGRDPGAVADGRRSGELSGAGVVCLCGACGLAGNNCHPKSFRRRVQLACGAEAGRLQLASGRVGLAAGAGHAPTAGSGRAGRWPAMPRTPCIRWPARA